MVLAIMPEEIPLPRLVHETQLLIQSNGVFVPGEGADAHAMHVGPFEAPFHDPLNRLGSVSFSLVGS